MTSRDEALRALPQKWRDDANQHVHDYAGCTPVAVVETLRDCADELAAILSARQEVAPEWFCIKTPGADYDYTFVKTREEAIDLQDCDEPDEPMALYSSPAHTSEARDAVVTDAMVTAALDAQPLTDENESWRVWQIIGFDNARAEKIMRAALNAAMRQEAGSRE